MNERLYKRKIRLLISIVLVLVMAFSGCNGKPKKQERKRENRQESQQEKKETVKADNKDLSKSETVTPKPSEESKEKSHANGSRIPWICR